MIQLETQIDYMRLQSVQCFSSVIFSRLKKTNEKNIFFQLIIFINRVKDFYHMIINIINSSIIA